MSLLISKTQFKARALELFRQVEQSGETIIITDRGQPKLELRRHNEEAISALAQMKGSLLHYDRPFDSVGEEDWEALNDPD